MASFSLNDLLRRLIRFIGDLTFMKIMIFLYSRYYATGTLHKPRDVCIDEFLAELKFWQIPYQVLAPCCKFQNWNFTKFVSGMSEVGYYLDAINAPQKSPSKSRASGYSVDLEYQGICCGNARKAIWRLIEVPESGKI